jgi:chromosome partitioning protein
LKGEKEMGKTISINIQKGGCGKSTTVQALAGSLTKKGFKCLVIDLDPQGNLTFSSEVQEVKYTVYELLKGECSFNEVVQMNKYYDIVPANISLSKAEQEFNEIVLRDILEPIKERYDYILIDTPPNLGVLSICSLVAADYLISPIEPSFYAFQGLEMLYETINRIKEHIIIRV